MFIGLSMFVQFILKIRVHDDHLCLSVLIKDDET